MPDVCAAPEFYMNAGCEQCEQKDCKVREEPKEDKI